MNLKNEDGFTLLEIILSIAILAVISGFILDMFIVSSNVNKSAQDLDIASTKAANALELFKSQGSPEGYAALSAFSNSFVEWDGSVTRIYAMFDEKWNMLPALGRFTDEDPVNGAKFVLVVKVTDCGAAGPAVYLDFFTDGRDISYAAANQGRMYDISATFYTYGVSGDDKTELLSLGTKKYFAY